MSAAGLGSLEVNVFHDADRMLPGALERIAYLEAGKRLNSVRVIRRNRGDDFFCSPMCGGDTADAEMCDPAEFHGKRCLGCRRTIDYRIKLVTYWKQCWPIGGFSDPAEAAVWAEQEFRNAVLEGDATR